MDQQLLAFLHELWSHLTDGKRLKPGISRMRHLAGHEANAEFDAWFLPLRQRMLERYPKGDRLALEWLSRPELFERNKHECHNQATSRFWLLAAWAGRYPPESGAQAVTAALESCLTSPRGVAYVYEGAGGLVRLVDHLKEQTPPAEHGALGRRFLDILAAPSFADRLETSRIVADAGGYIYYNDLVAQLRQQLGQRLLRAFLPGVVAEGRASDRELAIILQRFNLSDVPLDPPDWAMALARVSNQAADESFRTGDIEAIVVVMHGHGAGVSFFLRLCQGLERTLKLPEWDRSILSEARLLSQLQPPGPADLEQAQALTRYPACELISGALLAPAWLQLLEAGLGWSGLAEVRAGPSVIRPACDPISGSSSGLRTWRVSGCRRSSRPSTSCQKPLARQFWRRARCLKWRAKAGPT